MHYTNMGFMKKDNQKAIDNPVCWLQTSHAGEQQI